MNILNFSTLTSNIIKTNSNFVNESKQSINTCLTIRNWLFGYYIQEYALNGSDRAKYREKLLESLSKELQNISSNSVLEISQTASVQSLDACPADSIISPANLLKKLSFSHFVELIKVEDNLKRNMQLIEQ